MAELSTLSQPAAFAVYAASREQRRQMRRDFIANSQWSDALEVFLHVALTLPAGKSLLSRRKGSESSSASSQHAKTSSSRRVGAENFVIATRE